MFCKTHDKLNLYYEVLGNRASGNSIVFLNGLTQSTLSWSFIVPYFEKAYQIILLDLIFQGQSDKKGEWRDFDQHASDVRAVLDKEKIDRVVIAGLSYGSLVAQNFAVLFPQRLQKLILMSTFAHKTPHYNAIEQSWWHALEKGGYDLMLDIMLPEVLSESYFANPLISLKAMKEARKEVNQSPEALFKLMHATKDRKDYRMELNRITTPTIIIQGEKDMLFPVHLANEVHQNIKDSKFVIIKNAGHTLNLEQVPQVCKNMTEFLDQVK